MRNRTINQLLFVCALFLFASFMVSDILADVIIDNGAAGTSSEGIWQVSGGIDPYGIDSLWARDGATYTWAFESQPAGSYEVLIWWSGWSSRSSDVDVDINYHGATDSVSIDQSVNAGQWNSLGAYNFGTSGSVTIIASNGSTASSSADAVWFRLIAENSPPIAYIDSMTPNPSDSGALITFVGHGDDPNGVIAAHNWESSISGVLSTSSSFSAVLADGVHTIVYEVQDDVGFWSEAAAEVLVVGSVPEETIIDNLDAETEQTGTWSVSGGPDPYESDSVWSRNGDTFTWNFTAPEAGSYEVSMWWTEWPSRSASAPVTIEHAGGTDTVYVNQQTNGGQWNVLGTYQFEGISDGAITIIAEGSLPVSYCADAVKIIPGEANDSPTAFIDSITPNPALYGELVSFVGSGEDTDGMINGCVWTSSIDGLIGSELTFDKSDLSLGEHTISMTVEDDDGAISLAVTQTLTIEQMAEIIIDNGDEETSSIGAWSVSGGFDPYDEDSLWSRDGSTYTWTFTPPGSGYYEVSMWWTEWPSRSTTVPITIEYSGGSETVYVNQQDNGGTWNKVGEYDYEAGVSYNVVVTAGSGLPSTCADAVRILQIAEPGAPVAEFHADELRGAMPFSVQFNNQSIDATDWLWDFGDGQSSTLKDPSHTYTTAGLYAVSLIATGPYGTDTKVRENYIDIKPDNTENIYLIDGYGGNDFFIPETEQMLEDLGATKNAEGFWTYQSTNMTYEIHVVHDPEGTQAAFAEPDAHLVMEGHANYGFGMIFASPSEIWNQQIDDFYYVDDDRIVLYGTDMVSTKVDGMKYGQAYPNWEPIFKDGTDALMPYTFGDPRGNPSYNYYLTYMTSGDPNTYKIELADGSLLERFADSGVPPWFSADGSPPDPNLNPEYFIINNDEDFNRFEAVGDWVIKKVDAGGYSGLRGYMGYNYQAQWPGFGNKVATWNMVLRYPGQYRVLAAWFPDPTNATNAKYTINHSDGSTTVEVDQTVTAARNSLGVYNFDTAGSYTIGLNDNANGQVIADAAILRPVADAEKILEAEFSADVQSGDVPLAVEFRDRSYEYIYDYSVDVNDFYWDFGDGSTSRLEDPEHTYTTLGIYTVTLRIVDTDGYENTQVKPNFIAVGTEPVLEAEFYSTRRRGTQSTYVNFYNQSSGDITSWLWDFGDGETSTEQNPTHIFTVPGTYTVSLTVSGPDGTDSETEENYIYNFYGESYTDNTFQYKPHFYSRGYSTFGKVICNTGEVKVQEDDLRYTRMFNGACNSFQYFAETFRRGVMFANTQDVRTESYAGTLYLEYYLKGYSDADILDHVNMFEDIHEYYNFNLKPPSMR